MVADCVQPAGKPTGGLKATDCEREKLRSSLTESLDQVATCGDFSLASRSVKWRPAGHYIFPLCTTLQIVPCVWNRSNSATQHCVYIHEAPTGRASLHHPAPRCTAVAEWRCVLVSAASTRVESPCRQAPRTLQVGVCKKCDGAAT